MDEIDLKKLKSMVKKDEHCFNLTVHSKMFDMEIRVEIWDDPLIKKHAEIMNDFLTLSPKSLNIVKGLLFVHYWQMVSITDWPSMPNRENPFEILTANDALKKAGKPSLMISDVAKWKNRFCSICFNPVWEDEHGVEIIIKNGFVIDYGDSERLDRFEK